MRNLVVDSGEYHDIWEHLHNITRVPYSSVRGLYVHCTVTRDQLRERGVDQV
jgi:hypothetical protein